MEEDNPTFSQSDSVQIGDNAIGPSTGDIVINSKQSRTLQHVQDAN